MSEPRLEVTDVMGRRVVALDKWTFSIGRRSSNDLVLTGADISRDYAEIVESAGRYIIRDRGSQSGTLINGMHVTGRPLAHGDRIGIGTTSDVELHFFRGGVHDFVGGSRLPGDPCSKRCRDLAALVCSTKCWSSSWTPPAMSPVPNFAHGAAQHDDVTAMMVQDVGLTGERA